jgi:N-acetylglucosaminyldiphosphoundecaprenol N-acetyl-beta-D-mannosaminyltransferase
MSHKRPKTRRVIGFPVTALSFDDQITLMVDWATQRLSKTVCIANVHMLVEAYQNSSFAEILKRSDLVTPDGMPLVWMLRLMGVSNQDRIAGLDVLQAICQRAPSYNISVFFLGSEQVILDRIKTRLQQDFPTLQIAGMEPLPFRQCTVEEDSALVQRLNQSGAGIVFVSLGCPKQERWMAQHKGQVHAVMIGLGGAFPVYAGLLRRAPRLVRSVGLEWLYRLMQEPRRLWKRYSTTIPIFLWLASKQLLKAQRDAQTEGFQ